MLLWISHDPDARPGEGVIDCKGLWGGVARKETKTGTILSAHLQCEVHAGEGKFVATSLKALVNSELRMDSGSIWGMVQKSPIQVAGRPR